MIKKPFYATINRDSNSSTGTKIKLTKKKHVQTLTLINSLIPDVIEFNSKNEKETPVFLFPQDQWIKISEDIKQGIPFSKIFHGSLEICIIAGESFKKEILEAQDISEKARLDREDKEKHQNEEE